MNEIRVNNGGISMILYNKAWSNTGDVSPDIA